MLLSVAVMKARTLPVIAVLAVAGSIGGVAYAVAPAKNASFPDQTLSASQPGIVNDRGIRFGSIGSGMFRARTDSPHEFFMLTDRGPNGQPGGKRTFPVPEFNPTIVKVRVKGESIVVLEQIALKTTSGAPVSGLPNLSAVTSLLSSTPPTADEVPYNFDASATGIYNQNGIDSEDIVRTSTGEFWIVDEYRPSVLRVAANGTILARHVPVGLAGQFTNVGYPVYETLPATHAYRRQNRGYEGLAISPDGTNLFVALQSPLQLPPNVNTGRDSRNTRLLRLDLNGQVLNEYIYRFDDAPTFDPNPDNGSPNRARDMKISGLYAISDTRLLVLERTDYVAKIYLVDLAAATDLRAWSAPVPMPPLNYIESLNSDSQLTQAALAPIPKRLVIDLDTIDGMPDKIESITMWNPSVLVVANDNDFGLNDQPTWDANGRLMSDTGVGSKILYVTLPEALPLGPKVAKWHTTAMAGPAF